MTVRIGHASIDENRKARGGLSGDQTGGEVKISSWYNGKWQYVARAKEPAVAERIAAAAEAGCGNPHIGYDQGQRNTLLTEAGKWGFDLGKIDVPCETDCSAFVSVCVLAAGVELEFGSNLPTTSNLRSKLSKTKAFEIITDERHLIGPNYLRRGDILCKPGSHTVVVLDDGAFTGQSGGGTKLCGIQLPVLSRGHRGAAVRTVQTLLMPWDPGTVDGIFGTKTREAVQRFQHSRDLEPDGIIGEKTWSALITADPDA